MNLTKNHSGHFEARHGFTLAEVMLATFISSFVFAGVLSAYIFLGRSLTRQGNAEQLESRTRTALYYFNQDVSFATEVTIDSVTELALTVVNPTLNSTPPYFVSVVYTYDLQDNLTRNVYVYPWLPASPTPLINGTTLLDGPTASSFDNLDFSFGYYNSEGTSPYPQPMGTSWIKQVSMTFQSTSGSAASGAQSHFTVVSSQVTMKNKPILQ